MEHEKPQTAKDDWDEDIMKQVKFINKMLHLRNEAKAYTSNIDKIMLEYYEVLTKRIIRFLPSLRRSKKNGELLFGTVFAGLVFTSTLNK